MKLTRRIVTLLLALIMILSVSATAFAATSNFTGRMDDAETESAETPAHNYVNGFCTDCGAYEPATMVTEENYAALGLRSSHVGYYAIGNAGQLYWYESKVFNEFSFYYATNMVLTQNITVNTGTITAGSTNARTWRPFQVFDGTMDGNGHSISGLYCVSDEPYHCIGLISVLKESGVVKNLTITNSYFSGAYSTGGIAGYSCGTISGCVNYATVNSSVDRNSSYYNDCGTGGIVGDNNGSITYCSNNGVITGGTNVGGIAGNHCPYTFQNRVATVELCANTGSITGETLVGGIVGLNSSVIRNCWNTGSITATINAAGGIAGWSTSFEDDVSLCVMENCWSTGTVTCDGGSIGTGSIAGSFNYCTVRNCYGISAPIHTPFSNGNEILVNVEVKTREQFASGEVAYLLGGVWGQNIDNGKPVQTVPVFSNATVYQIGTGIYSNDPNAHSHSYNNGFCTDCDAYEPAPLVTSDNYSQLGLSASDVGFYAISNAGQLYWFAQRSVEYPKDNAVLAKNITVNSGTVNASSVGLREWTPIAGCNNDFYGTFDGNGKTISGLYYKHIGDGDGGYYVGLVSILGKTGVVKNVTISNSYLEAFWHIGAIAGHNDGLISGCGNNSTTIKSECNAGGITGVNMGTIELCGNSGNITATDQIAGGIAGRQLSIVRNCWNTGNIKTGQYDAGGIAGLVAHPDVQPAPVENCWSTGTVTCDGGETAGGLVGMGFGSLTVRNCYTTMDVIIGQKDTSGGTPNISKVETKTRDQFTSGEVAYLLQKDLTTPIWGQNLDNGKPVQTVPLFSTATVYQIKLDDKGAVGYSNDPNADPNDFASATQPEETKPEETNPEETTSKNTKPEASKPEDQAAVDTQSPADGTGSAGIYILISILGLLAVAAAVLLVIKFRRKSAG